MSGKNSYASRVMEAISKGDDAAINTCINKVMQELGDGLVRFVNQFPKEDLPFVVAVMKITAGAFEGVLSEPGKKLCDNLVSSAATILTRRKGGKPDA